MPDLTTYTGACHCGKVRFEFQSDLGRVIACNCSLCAMTHWRLSFVAIEQFKLLAGEESLVDYQFGKKKLHHPFCRECGIHAFSSGVMGNGKEMRGINLRCVEGLDVDALPVTPYDGKSL